MADTEPRGSIIDTKVPVTWLISTSGALIVGLLAIGFQFNAQATALSAKMDAVLQSNTEMKTQLREREVKYDSMRDAVYTLQRAVDAHDIRIIAVEKGFSRR